MNNETKWDVFEDALRALEEFGEQGSSWEMAYDDLSARYSAASDEALPDNMPVIPKAVGKYIRWCKGEGGIGNVSDAMGYAPTRIASWIYDERNSDTFASAWVLGVWRVEEIGEIVKSDVK
ncbi:hypothetical protein K9848_07035 [Latilactobacillus sakei]|uniref:hypothetical protein n=1 Tax=Latilactobacillus sakei TaxID=1599 RepID=UPI0020C773EB|nr:hypothetical protein [Latilactobacillus sakei]MCP8855946.1 hypothetical protein [Latilactobacillus sakei]